MLPRSSRMTRSAAFGRTVREGSRAGGRLMVLHLRRADEASLEPPEVGFVVSKSVGGAVVRNRVERRLRHVARALLVDLDPGCSLVVRALPDSARASYAELGDAMTSGLARLTRHGA